MSETPETDACKSATRGESIFDLCERLECERDEWRKCAERLAAIVGANESEFHIANDIESSLEEFNQLKNKYEQLCN